MLGIYMIHFYHVIITCTSPELSKYGSVSGSLFEEQ